MRCTPLALASFALLLTGCPDNKDDVGPDDTGSVDSGGDAGGGLDAKPDAAVDDVGVTDTGEMTPDTGNGMDAGDAGMNMPGMTLFPGVGVQVGANRIDIGTDTFDSVNTKLAGAARMRNTTDSARSYEYTVGADKITIWYANTNLDDDGQAPMDVDGTDQVLWIAVQDGFAGTTPDGVGLDSNRGDVEGAYGAPPHTVDVVNPAGTISQYYTTGLVVAYEPNGDVRTITISRAYPTEPDGEIDPPGRRVTFGGTELMAALIGGTSMNNITNLLGQPDAQGTVNVGGQDLETLSYGFIGIEAFLGTVSHNLLTLNLHPPFYGTTSGGLGMGSARADLETYLGGLGFDNGTASSNPQFICYDNGSVMVGVTYTMADNRVSSITLALPACP